MTKVQKLFLVLCIINPVCSKPENFQVNHRQLLPFDPDPGGNITCTGSGDPVCGKNGLCVSDWLSQTNWTCHCDKGWFTSRHDVTIHVACSTKQPEFLIALLLQIFLGWLSAGAFYLGWYIYATISFMTLACVCVFNCIICPFVVSKENNDNTGMIVTCSGCLLMVVVCAMWIVNLVTIVNDCYNSHGIPCSH